jgi:hypothetical protein
MLCYALAYCLQAGNNVSVTFMKAVLAIQQGEFEASEVHIDETRMLLDSKVAHHNTSHHNTAQHNNTTQHNITQHSTTQHNHIITQHSTTQHNIT